MTKFKLHDLDSAPEGSAALLEQSLKTMGMIPNLYAVMAESPEFLTAYQQLHQLFMNTSLGPEEKTVVWQTINVEHACHYCVPAHTAIAKSMHVADDITDALRNETPLADPKLEALRNFTLKVIRQRGHVEDSDVSEFLAAGYSHRHIMEILVGMAQKVMSNYINAIAQTPLDAPFEKFAWQKSD